MEAANNSSDIVAVEEETEIEKFDKHGFLKDPLELEAENICNGLWFVDNNIYSSIFLYFLVLKLMRLLLM